MNSCVPCKNELKMLRQLFAIGARVRLIKMHDSYSSLPSGEEGTVIAVDDIGSVHVRWDCGFCLAAVWQVDAIELI